MTVSGEERPKTMAQGHGDGAPLAQNGVDEAQKLLDFSHKLDIKLLDSVVDVMNSQTGERQAMASKVLTELKDHPDSWTRVDAILEFSHNQNTRFYALQILERVIQIRWKSLPAVQCDGIKSFIVALIIKISSDPQRAVKEKTYLAKLNLVLVQIVKHEWPKNWPTFISDIVGSSRNNPTLCLNNMLILKLLSEEVFDFSDGQVTQAKAHRLKTQFCGEFQAVFQLCQFVMDNSSDLKLVEATLETLLKFLNWIPVGYIFETDLIERLINNFLKVNSFRNVTLKCLMEVSSVVVPDDNTNYLEKLITMFVTTLDKLKEMMPIETNIRQGYANGADAEQKFIANLAMFLCTFLKEHGKLVEMNGPGANDKTPSGTPLTPDEKLKLVGAHSLAMEYLLKISEVEDVEIFKICLDYWSWLAAELYRECPFICTIPSALSYSSLYGSGPVPPRRRLYNPHLIKLRYVVIGRMAKPEEVLVVENEQGEVVRETIKDTDSINLYKTMRETLVFLTHLDYVNTEQIMTEKLMNQVNGTEWSWKNLNTLCWAIGSISGSMLEEDEKRFLVTVIRDLLGLCEQKRGKDNKAVIASNIMYVVGQYPRFLRAHWKFLKTVVNKLFEFMHETHEGVQDMACDTFIKIAQKCRRHFVVYQLHETQPFIEELLANLNMIICDLSPPQVHVFYEACGYIIGSQSEEATRDDLIEKLMALPNSVWDEIIAHAATDAEVLKQPDVVKNLANILKTNVAVCKAIGSPFICQLGKIYLDMLNVYKVTSENISCAVATHGESVLKQPLIKGMRGIKTESLKLISTWVQRCDDDKADLVLTNFVPPLFDAVLFDYQRNVSGAREPEVLAIITAFINRLKASIAPEVPRIFDAVFQCTLDMINKDFHEFPEHRINFFLLIQATNEHCFAAFLQIPSQQFKLVLDSIVWGFKHSMRNVAEIGLDVLKRLLFNVANKTEKEAAQSFYQNFFTLLLEHLLSVVTDSSQAQVAGLTYYAEILADMFSTVEDGMITVPLNQENPAQSNMDYIYEFVGRLLQTEFPHLTEDQLRVTVKGFYSFDKDIAKFKEHLRDFLVQLKEYHGSNTADLFLEEREEEIQEAQRQKKHVPGLLNPYDSDSMKDVTSSAPTPMIKAVPVPFL